MKSSRPKLALALLGGALLFLSGCMTKPLQPVRADGTYCHKIGKSYRPTITCTTAPVPSAEVEVAAKRFEPNPGVLTVYVVRKRWDDARNTVEVNIDGATRVTTIPESLMRLRLKPGEHRLALDWEGRKAEKMVSGGAGDVRFVELVGSLRSWGSTYGWEDGSLDDSRTRAVGSKLIADLAIP